MTAAVLVVFMPACVHTPSTTLPSRHGVENNPVLSGGQLCRGEESLLGLLGLLDDFNRANAEGRATIYERVSTKAVLEPTAPNRLAFAMLKAVPGHHGYNLESAQTLLSAVLEDSNMLPTGVLHFARVYARSISEQRKLAQRNRLLNAELTDARDKLEALTEIEREVDLPAPEAEGGGNQPKSGFESNSSRVPQHGEPQKNSASR